MKYIFLILILIYSAEVFSQLRDSLSCECKTLMIDEDEDGTPAEFPGGPIKYRKWILKQLEESEKEIEASEVRGNCKFSFVIDTSGKVTNIKICTLSNTYAEVLIRRIYAQSPLWKPAVSTTNGKTEQKICQTIVFGNNH
ncbi:MAG: hypothetical protein IPH18_02055 [Chitinophagaceae bacterium]|nr:hypothetical protein [Chitinophagaceae bacterium]